MAETARQPFIDEFPEIVAFDKRYEEWNSRVSYFKKNDGIPGGRISIEGEEKINFSTYNYLGLNGDKRINDFVKNAIDRYGTSVSSSRLLTGEIELHEMLEKKIASMLGTDDAIVFVGGHSTNVNIIGNLVGPEDLIVHDALAHNSSIQGCILSRAKRMHFKHNNMEHLEGVLQRVQGKYRRVLIIAEGVYSMDGDICDLPGLIRLKKQYGALLMVDEAHSFGTLGKCGRGVTSYFGVDPKDVDILMGTLSKSAASCGGYIAGSTSFIRFLRYNSPGFVFSCGITPPNAAAAYKAIELFEEDPERIERLHENSEYFLKGVKALGYDTGLSADSPVVPIIIGDSVKTLEMSQELFKRGVNALPIIHPAVREDEARVRFFMSAAHTREDLDETLEILTSLRDKI